MLSRQGLPHVARTPEQVADIARGAYVLLDCQGAPEAIVIATGSEVAISLEAVRALQEKGRRVRLVAMPSADVFEAQPADYREAVLPATVRRRVAVEAAHVDWWRKYVGLDGAVVGMTTFGESAPGKAVLEYFGFTPARVAEAVEALF